MIGILRRNNIFALGFCLLLLLILWLPRLFLDMHIPSETILHNLQEHSLWLGLLPDTLLFTALAFLLTFLSGTICLFLINRYSIQTSNDFLFPLLYVLLASAIPATQWFSGAQAACFLILVGINFLFTSFQRLSTLGNLFIAACCFSLATLCFPPGLMMLLFLPLATLTVRPFSWRDGVVLLVAIITPIAYLLFYYWLSAGTITGIGKQLLTLLPEWPEKLPSMDLPVLFFFGTLAILLLVVIASIFFQPLGIKVQVARLRLIFTWMLVFAVAGFLFYPAYNEQIMPLLAIPVTVIMGHYFTQPKKRKMKIFCWLLLFASILYLQVAEFL